MNKIIQGEASEVLKTLESESVQTCVTSPPYFGLRDYGVKGQVGLEETPEEYVEKLVAIFREVRRVLKDDGTLWLNLGDSYSTHQKRQKESLEDNDISKASRCRDGSYGKGSGLPDKNLVGIPWRVALALQADGWYLRQDIIWHKPNPMPESVRDRCTKAHEYIFLLSKSQRYYFDNEAIMEKSIWADTDRRSLVKGGVKSGGKTASGQYATDKVAYREDGMKNKRSVWTVTTKPYKGAHFATFPPDLIRPCILAGAPKEGVVLDPFIGSGTTAAVAKEEGRQWLGIELNADYIKLAEKRIAETLPPQQTLL